MADNKWWPWPNYTFGILLLCLVLTQGLVLAQARPPERRPKAEAAKEDVEDREIYFARRRGLQFGVPKAAYSTALTPLRARWRSRMLQGAPTLAWQFIGPQPILGNFPNFAGYYLGDALDSSTGRVTALAADKLGTHRIFVGTAAGGVWMSKDDGGHFESIFDSSAVIDLKGNTVSPFVPTQVVGSLALDTTTEPTTVYVGTGEGNGGDSYYGAGIFRSSDLGKTWVQFGKDIFSQRSVGALAIDTAERPPHIFAGVVGAWMFNRTDIGWSREIDKGTGLWRSLDGGLTWQHYVDPHSPPSSSELPSDIARLPLPLTKGPSPVLSVVILPGHPSTILAGVQFDTLFRSTNGGDSWNPVNLTADDSKLPPQGRQTLAASNNPRAAGTIYALVGDRDSRGFIGLFRSSDSGSDGSWIRENVPSAGVGPYSIDGEGSYSQEDYDQALAVDPSDKGAAHIAFGGVGLYTSSDSGKLWTFIVQAGGTHADQHAIAYIPSEGTSSNFLVGNDGGVYLYDTVQETFSSYNTSLSATQIQSIAPHPTDSSRVLAGFQDNGTELYTGQKPWQAVETGDGGMTLFDPVDGKFAYHTFSTDSKVGPTLAMSTDSGVTWDSDNSPETDLLRKLLTSEGDAANFYPPLAADPKVRQRLFFGAKHIYVANASSDGSLTWQKQENADLTSGCGEADCSLADIEFDPTNHTRACALSPQFVRVDQVEPIVKTTVFPFKLFCTQQADLDHSAIWSDLTSNLERSFPRGKTAKSTQATGIAFDPNNPSRLYVSLSGFSQLTGVGHVYGSSDFGKTWTRADGAASAEPLPDVPVLRLLVDSTDKTGGTLLAGTDVGIFRSLNSGKTWSIFNLDTLPPVPVFDIQQNRVGSIFAGTHGRGAFRLISTQ